MRTRIALSLLFLGTALLTFGGLFKLMHWPSADIQLMFGGLVQVTALIALAINVLRQRTWKGFLNEA